MIKMFDDNYYKNKKKIKNKNIDPADIDIDWSKANPNDLKNDDIDIDWSKANLNSNNKDQEKILCAAIALNINDDDPPVIIGRYRHGNCFQAAVALNYGKYISQDDQGFLTTKGRFVNRAEAKIIARNANQLLRYSAFKNLISEDIY